jgi:NAD(P)-dependent dehydrogenase (short-subunit alcohol dehydrogenase family)
MGGTLHGRVAVVTGAGRGLGRAHALQLASEGAAVVVNDRGGDVHGGGSDPAPAEVVAKEITSMGGRAVASAHDVADWMQAGEMIRLAVSEFGDVHVLVNNAGILRDRTLANMDESEWDEVIRVHLKGHAAPTRHALAHWRDRSRAGIEVRASVVHTSSIAAFAGNFGQANYSSAKLGILALSRVVSLEGARYGVRSNVVSPAARTRISLEGLRDGERLAPPAEAAAFDRLDPANVSPLIAWLAAADCPADGQIFQVLGDEVWILSMPRPEVRLSRPGRRWTIEDLARELPGRLLEPLSVEALASSPPESGSPL